MLTMSKDHTLYYEAYNDASDLNDDGTIDTTYNPNIDYYGYFDSYKYYEYDTILGAFKPAGTTSDKKSPSGYWSGDFLNYLTMSRIDVLRKVLYGGFRRVDTASTTILERANIPNDAHCWGKEYSGPSSNGFEISDYTPFSAPSSGTRHLFASGSREAATATSNKALLRVKLNSSYRISRWVSNESGEDLLGDAPVGAPDYEYQVRVVVGVKSLPDLESEKLYTDSSGNTVYKPIGLLQRYGESGKIYFGLMTGTYKNNLSGGVLRKNVGPITDEINNATGEFKYIDGSYTGGIVSTIDHFTVKGFNYGSNYWDNTIYSRPIVQGENIMWGNPMAEMMYESLRYFSGKSATAEFTANVSNGNDNGIALPLAAWKDPYKATTSGGLGYPTCSKPFILALSDINPSYDTNQLPNVYSSFNSGFSGTLTTNGTSFNAKTLADTVSSTEGIGGNYFIGQSQSTTDYSCSEKTISSLSEIRGLCPEEPTKLGGYYSASVAYYGKANDVNSAADTQSIHTYAVALASPLPKIEIPMNSGRKITLVPFAKTVYSTAGGGVSPAYGSFQPTCAMVDFYVEELTETYGKFIVSFEHSEQGSDFDMDGLVQYEYTKTSSDTVEITITNINNVSGGGSKQHFGYIISGTDHDGIYLDVKNKYQPNNEDPDYYLDTPPGEYPQGTYSDYGSWKDGTYLPITSTRSFHASSVGAGLLEPPLWYAAKWGGFDDVNDSGTPDLEAEWDQDQDGVPDTYFFVANPGKLESQLNKAFNDILSRVSSGTAASVISQSREGDGAIYQSIFFPEKTDDNGDAINWVGQVHALFVDTNGNIREDSNRNHCLDAISDKIIIFDDTDIYRFQDANGDNTLSDAEIANSTEILNDSLDISFLWSSSDWLNGISDAEVVSQRSQYNATTSNRYILTFADKDNDMVVDSNEIQDFVWPPSPSPNQWLNATRDFYTYLTLYPSFDDTPTAISKLRTDDIGAFGTLLGKLAERQVDFIRGADQTALTISGYEIPAGRSRQYADNGVTRTWRLGDVVYSTPTVVGAPSEGYNMLYLDSSYQDFLKQYKNRRQMVYVGANDGMLHAFNGGFYNSTSNGFDLQRSGEVAFPLGMEVWGYVPYNLLPHLRWLSESDYSSALHVCYMDLKPRIFDARIFFEHDGITPIDSDHPSGWGTVLVAGMRLGGGTIRADVDKTVSNAFDASVDRTMSSAYVIMDITNPEIAPTVLAEIHMPYQGFTTCYPTAMPMTTPDATTNSDNQWYLVFGSGPASATGTADPACITTGVSAQNGRLYVLDLKNLAVNGALTTLDSSGEFTTARNAFAQTEANSFIADPIAMDLNIGDGSTGEFKTDLVYYGTSAGTQTAGTGTMRRLVSANAMPSGGLVSWYGSMTLADVGKPVTSAPSVAMDDSDNLWVYFGAGRFYNRNDIPQSEHMSFYGIKDPIISGNNSSIDPLDLFNSTQITLDNGTCPGSSYSQTCVGVYQNGTALSGGWSTLVSMVETYPGWRQDFTADYERVLGQPSTLSGAVIFTTYLPSNDLCEFEGISNLWALYYKTGTAYFKPILSGSRDAFITSIGLGRGMTVTPNLHVGSKSGSTAFIQTSTGAIETIDIDNPISTKSGTLYWKENAE